MLIQDNVVGFRRTFVKKPKTYTKEIFKLTFGLFGFIWMLVLLSRQVYASIEPYTNVFNLHIYQMIERDGECNKFVNGYQEEITICPNYLKEKKNARW